MDIRESYERVINNPTLNFAHRFYERVTTQYPEIGGYFTNVQMMVQAVMLPIGLDRMVRHYQNRHVEQSYLTAIGFRHFRLGIPLELFPKFTGTML